jgi:uncharacterized protein YacL
MKDRFIGLLFILIGTVFGIGAQNYNLGTWDSPGPGLFPTLCSVVVFVIGIISIIKSFTQPSSSVDFKIKYIGLITSSLILFAVVTEYLGIICGIVVLVLGTSLRSINYRFVYCRFSF